MSTPNTSAYWSREDTITLIDIYKSHECLCIVRCFDYKSRFKRAAAIMDIAQTISRCVNDVKKKLDSLRNQHRREIRLMCTSKKSGVGSDKIHTPKLWCFDIVIPERWWFCTASWVKYVKHREQPDYRNSIGGCFRFRGTYVLTTLSLSLSL